MVWVVHKLFKLLWTSIEYLKDNNKKIKNLRDVFKFLQLSEKHNTCAIGPILGIILGIILPCWLLSDTRFKFTHDTKIYT